MINLITERKAVHDIASLLTSFKWIFHEKPIADFGIDAVVETTKDLRPSGKFFALQIKGGKSLRKGRSGFTFYFSNAHAAYWKSVDEGMPMLLMFQDSEDGQIYWQHITEEGIKYTQKKWKLDIPYNNQLNVEAAKEIEVLVHNYIKISDDSEEKILSSAFPEKDLKTLKVGYLLSKQKKELCILLSDNFEERIISLDYIPGSKNWDKNGKRLSWQDPFFFTLMSLEHELKDKYDRLTQESAQDKLLLLEKEINDSIKSAGLEELASSLFNKENDRHGIPSYEKFKKAFEYFSGLKKGQYIAKAVGELVYFENDGVEWQMDTYHGLTARLRTFIEKKSYTEIYTETNKNFWSEIYLDAGIEKEKFVPQMLREWETYWDEIDEERNGDSELTKLLNENKVKSWRQMQVFMEGYNDVGDVIGFAWELNDYELYPLAVITMLNIFDPDTCYNEYCEYEFFAQDEWESICVDDDSDVFFIKQADF